MHIYPRIIEDLEKNLPKHLTYHNSEHTKLVIDNVIFISKKEKFTGHDFFLLKIAALYHDTGYKITHINHEAESCKIARQELTEVGLEDTDIAKISNMIMATHIPQQPKTLAEKILADADLEYLGTEQFEGISNLLYLELKHFRPLMTLKEWHKIQIDFISKHNYHTEYCKKNREKKKQENLKKLKEKIELV